MNEEIKSLSSKRRFLDLETGLALLFRVKNIDRHAFFKL